MIKKNSQINRPLWLDWVFYPDEDLEYEFCYTISNLDKFKQYPSIKIILLILNDNDNNILINNERNIGYFLQKTDKPLGNNVILRTYINEETKKLCLLCITCRKIKKGETLIVYDTQY